MSGVTRAPLRPYLISRLPLLAVGVGDVGGSQRLVGCELGGYAVVLEVALPFVERKARSEDVVGSTRRGMLEVSIHFGDCLLVDIVREAIPFGG